MWYALQGVSRALPMIFMGTETLQKEWWHVDIDHRFNWDLVEKRDKYAEHMMNCVRDINKLRLSTHAFTSENIRFVHEDSGNSVLGWIRSSDDCGRAGDVYLCAINLGENEWSENSYDLHTGCGPGRSWVQIFNSQSEKYGGWHASEIVGNLASDQDGKIRINLPKWSLLVFYKV
jgi:1,4-alpha-glucan branching enzyme